MKDAKGHGSDPRAGHKLAADYRASHQLKMNTIPTVARAVGAELARFAKNTSGSGKSLLHEPPDDSEKYQNASETYAELMSHHGHMHIEPSHLMHLAHFIHSMTALAVADVLVRSISNFM